MKKKALLPLFLVLVFCGISAVEDTHSINYSQEEQLIVVAVGAFKDGFLDIAEKQLSQFAKQYPTHGKVQDIHYLLGKTLLLQGKLREARTAFLRILNENKNFESIDYTLFWLAEIEAKLGNGEEAKRFLLSIIKRFPKFELMDYSYYLLGLLDLESNKLSSAETSLKKVPLLSKNNQLIRSSFFWLGILLFSKKDYEAAASYFRIIWEDPQYVPPAYLRYALFWLGETHLRLRRFSEAKLNYRTFSEQFKNDPLIPDITWRLGFCEYRLGNFKYSAEIFHSLKNQLSDANLILSTHYILGKISMIIGDYSSSIKEINSVLSKSQENMLSGFSILALFWNYIHLGEMDGANKVFQRLQKLSHFEDEKAFIQWLNAELIFFEGRIPDSLPYYFNIVNTRFREKALFQIGKGYFFESKFREAITNLDILLLEFPNSEYSEECLFMKGECLNKLGILDRALETYDLIVKQGNNNVWLLFALTQMGNLYLFRNESNQAENAFKKAIDNFPNHPLFYHAAFTLGNLHFKSNRIAEAIPYYTSVLKGNLLELFGEVHFSLGEIFYIQGKYEKAFASFETAIRYLKDTSTCFFLTQLEMGNLQRKWGKYEEAKKAYMTILNQSKDQEIKSAAKTLLSHMGSQ